VRPPPRTDGLRNLGRPLPRAFYARPVLEVARALLGRWLVHDHPAGRVAGRIVEVEAYGGPRDPASHARAGRTARNASMFGPPGHAYVYFTYGMHFCVNVVAGRSGQACAVLIRALEPGAGIASMRRRRGALALERLARGPGCVARALGLTRAEDGSDLTRGPLWIGDGPRERAGLTIAAGPRIGIRAGRDRDWRLFLDGHPCVSGTRAAPRSAQHPGRAHPARDLDDVGRVRARGAFRG
jgi:DNA-3-methyladenine glycosylase